MRLTSARSISLLSFGLVAAVTLAACGQDPTADEALNVSGTADRSASATTSENTTMSGLAEGLTDEELNASEANPSSTAPASDAPTTGDSRADAAANSALILTEIRIGQYNGADRTVFQFDGPGTPGYMVSYVDNPMQQGSGNPLDVPGSAFLQVMMTGQTIPMDDSQQEVSRGTVTSPDAPGIRGVHFAGQFEGMGQAIIGLDSERPYSVFTLSNPTRLVVDVQQ